MNNPQSPPKKLFAKNWALIAGYACLFAFVSRFDTNAATWSKAVVALAGLGLVTFSLYLVYHNSKYLWARFNGR